MRPNHRLLVSLAALPLLALAGCGGSTGPASPSAEASGKTGSPAAAGHDGHDHEAEGDATETAEASPRLAVGTATGIVLLDEHLKVLATYETTARPALTTASDGRHVLAVQTEAGTVNVLDTGTWAQGHGDHFHYYVTEPEMLADSLAGGRPIHVVPNAKARVTTVFFDADGKAQVLDTETLRHAELHGLATIDSKGPHHGVVVPQNDRSWLVTQPAGTDGGTPDTVDRTTADGTVRQTFDCKGLHGEVVVGNTTAFGCADKVLIVREGQATDVAYPDASGERVGGIVSDAKATTFVGDYASDSLLFVSNDTATVVNVGTEYSNIAVTADDRFVVLGTDGKLRLYDRAGTELQTIEVTGAWTKPSGHGGISPKITAGVLKAANMVWVTEPGANKVHAVDLFANTVTGVEVAGQPSSVAVANAAE